MKSRPGGRGLSGGGQKPIKPTKGTGTHAAPMMPKGKTGLVAKMTPSRVGKPSGV